jgi:class 3 adenylate cyclase/tetratricopeptide (TPR) repeat protein
MRCQQCESENAPGKGFCGDCGAPLADECSACGAENPSGKEFCGECGARLTRKTSALSEVRPSTSLTLLTTATIEAGLPSAERRQLTVMFCDLVGSTALSARLDPEDMRDIINEYHACVAETVTRFDGFLAKYMGDGVIVYFGYPKAQEDDAEQAVRASLAVVECVSALKCRERLVVRVGLATGLVVVGEQIGSGVAQERAAVGDAPNLAARLQAAAEPNGVVISASTRRLTGAIFEYRDLGELKLTGLPEPIQAWQVLRESSVASRFNALRSSQTRLVGRDEELAILEERWTNARAGAGEIVLISGEPGIGKSRLVSTLSHSLRGNPHVRVRCFCSSHHSVSPLYPVITRLEEAAGLHMDDSACEKREKLSRLLAQSGATAEEYSLIRDLLSIAAEPTEAALEFSAPQRKARTLAALARQIEALATKWPVLMIWEDIHWADATSRELLDILVARAAELPLFLLATFRTGFVAPWTGQANVTLLPLNRLRPVDNAALINSVAGGKSLPNDLVCEMVDRADGIPLFIEELTKALLESGMLRDDGSHFALVGVLQPRAIPMSLQASLLARLDRLGSVREIAQVGAAIGREFSYDLLVKVGSLQPDVLKSALAELARAELVFERGEPPAATYSFKHALIQDAAYSTLLKARRQQLHARIADVLAREYSGILEGQPEIIARHAAEAGLFDTATTLLVRAGKLALSRSSNREAAAHFSRGLELAKSLPHGHERASVELDLHLGCASASIASKGYAAAETEQAYQDARELLDVARPDARQFAVLYGLFVVLWNRAKPAGAVEVATDLLQRAKLAEEAAATCVGHRSLAVAYNAMGRFREALGHATSAARLYDPVVHRSSAVQYGHDIGVAAHAHVALARWFLGDAAGFEQASSQSITLAYEIGHANTIGYAEQWSTFVRLAAGEAAEAETGASRLIKFATEHGLAFWEGLGQCMLGGALIDVGKAVDGLVAVETGLEALERGREGMFRSAFLCVRAKGLLCTGRYEDALAVADSALKTARISQERWWEPEILRVTGQALLAAGGPRSKHRAATHLREAIEVARIQGSQFLQLRAATTLAMLRRDQDRVEEARAVLAPAYRLFNPKFPSRDLSNAQAMLAQLGSIKKHSPGTRRTA